MNTCEWIAEENMKVWQIDLYHRVTEENGLHMSDRSKNTKYGFRPRINPPARHIEDQSPDYTPERDHQPVKSKRTPSHGNANHDNDGNNKGTDWRKTILQPRNTPPTANNARHRVHQVQRNSDGSIIRNESPRYAPYQSKPRQSTQSAQRSGPTATNVRITKAILDSILKNPDYFTQINCDQPAHLCTFLKVIITQNIQP